MERHRGTHGRGLRLEGIEIRLDYNNLGGGIEYRTHVQNDGWQDYVANGEMSGTKGRGLRFGSHSDSFDRRA